MSNEEIIARLSEVVSLDYKWPDIPKGWQLVFIVYPDRSVEMDLLHIVSCQFWKVLKQRRYFHLSCRGHFGSTFFQIHPWPR